MALLLLLLPLKACIYACSSPVIYRAAYKPTINLALHLMLSLVLHHEGKASPDHKFGKGSGLNSKIVMA